MATGRTGDATAVIKTHPHENLSQILVRTEAIGDRLGRRPTSRGEDIELKKWVWARDLLSLVGSANHKPIDVYVGSTNVIQSTTK